MHCGVLWNILPRNNIEYKQQLTLDRKAQHLYYVEPQELILCGDKHIRVHKLFYFFLSCVGSLGAICPIYYSYIIFLYCIFVIEIHKYYSFLLCCLTWVLYCD